MREKESFPSERNPNHQWTLVTKKKPKPFISSAKRTCFVNYLPVSTDTKGIAAIFKSHGSIDSIYIPSRQKKESHLCAFVQFMYPQSLPSAIRDEHGRRLGNHRITVHYAKYDKPFLTQNPKTNSHHHPTPKLFNTTKINPSSNRIYNRRDSRSYKEVAFSPRKSNHILIQSPENYPPQLFSQPKPMNPTKPPNPDIPQTTYLKAKPSPHRIMSSRALGEDTEETRKTLGEIDENGDYAAALKGEFCEDKRELLERSAIAVSASSQSSEDILSHILSEGVNCLKINPMGGMLHLITFDSFEDKEAMMCSKWLEKWFVAIRNVNDESSMLWRETWIKVYGVPLIGWDYKNFYKIGCVFGRVLSVNQKNFECAHILIITDCLFEINNKLSLEIGGKVFPIYVSETKVAWLRPQKDSMHGRTSEKVNELSPRPHDSSMESPQKNPDADDQSNQTKNPPQNLNLHFSNHDPTNSNDLSNDKLGEDPKKLHKKSENPNSPNTTSDTPKKSPKASPRKTQSQSAIKVLSPCGRIFKKMNLQSPIREPIDFSSPLKVIEVPRPKSLSPITSSAQPKLPSPTKKPPIGICNRFGPLIKPSKSLSTSSGTMTTSSCSGPLFPPGFEDKIPTQLKMAQMNKRRKKLDKKKRLKLLSQNCSQPSSPTSSKCFGAISVDSILEMANILGLSYEGSPCELRKRIQDILQGQLHEWDSHQM